MLRRHNKHNARKVRLDGFVFDSIAESVRYQELRLMERIAQIARLEVHPKWPIYIGTERVCFVELDFKYIDKNGDLRYEDVKGQDTAMSRLKRRMLEAAYPEIHVEIVRMKRRRRAA